MKLIEKKCPNCGGDLEFNASDNEVTCKYCQRSFIIEKDINSFSDYEYNLIFDTTKNMINGKKALVVAISILIIFAVSIVILVKTQVHRTQIKTNHDKQVESLEDLDYITDYRDINEDLLDSIKMDGINALNNDINFYVKNFMPKIVKRWQYIGSYFLVKNNTDKNVLYDNNILYDVYEIVYNINNENVSYYGVVVNSKFKKINDEIVTLKSAYTVLPKNEIDSGDYVFGYISLKSVYNDLISKKLSDYTIKLGIDNN